MKIFKLIQIDIDKERERIVSTYPIGYKHGKPIYNKRQQKALLKLCDMFEAGDWQGCLDHINNKKIFPYNNHSEYPETEHIGIQMLHILRDLGSETFFTVPQLKAEIKREK